MKKISFLAVMLAAVVFVALDASAKAKFSQEPVKEYNFKAVEKVAILPITSDGVDLGKVADDRKPKIEAILEKVKKNLRSSIVKGAKDAKTSIPFYADPPDKKPTTLLVKFNISKFDNGNQAARLVPFAGKAEVTIDAQFLDGKDKKVLAALSSTVKEKGGVVPGGLDSEVLWRASNIASSEILKKLNDLTGLKYDFWSGATKGVDDAFKNQADVMKEEKSEKDTLEKKAGTKKKK